jgi:methionyl aminopeptidase
MAGWHLKTPEEIELLRAAGRIVFGALEELTKAVRPGITTAELDKIGEMYIRDNGAEPAFLGYQGFPASVCVSIDDEVVHGIPGARRLEEGMIVSFDVGSVLAGYYGDAARTVAVGSISTTDQQLIDTTREALYKGIEQARIGRHLFDISAAIQRHAEKAGYSVVRDLVGHGIGKQMHEEPQVPNYGTPGGGPELVEGLVIAIEPMVNLGSSAVHWAKDKWTVKTKDGAKSAHFEHTIAVTANGPEILTAEG